MAAGQLDGAVRKAMLARRQRRGNMRVRAAGAWVGARACAVAQRGGAWAKLAEDLQLGCCRAGVWAACGCGDAGWQSGRTQATGAVRVQLWCGWQPIVVRVRGVGISGLKRGLHRRAHVCAAFLRARKPGGMQGRGAGWVLGEGTPRSLFSHALLQLTMDSSVSFTRCVVHPARVRTCGLHRHTEVSRGQGARVCLGSRADIFFLAACMQAGAVRVCADCVIGPARRNA